MGGVRDKGFAIRQQSYELLLAKVAKGRALSANEISAMTRFEKELAGAGLDVPTYLDTIDDVCRYTDYKARTIYAAIQSGELIRLSDNRFLTADVDAFLAGKNKRPQVRTVIAADQEDEDPDDQAADGKKYKGRAEEAKYRHFRAKKEEILVKQLEGELISREESGREFLNRIHEFRTALLLLGRRIGHRIAVVSGCDSRLVEEIFDAEAKTLLKSMSRKVVIHVD